MLALFDGGNANPRFLTFKGKRHFDKPDTAVRGNFPRKFTVRINGISREDGSGESWILEGYDLTGDQIKGYYNSKRREGHFRVETRTRRQFPVVESVNDCQVGRQIISIDGKLHFVQQPNRAQNRS